MAFTGVTSAVLVFPHQRKQHTGIDPIKFLQSKFYATLFSIILLGYSKVLTIMLEKLSQRNLM